MAQDKYALIYNKVKECMEKDRLFLRRDLSLKMLSRIVGTNTVYLSRAINEGYGCRLNTVVNRYRLDYLIRKAMRVDETIEELAAQLGFWSRSTFYDVFHDYTGMSPRRYMDQKKAKASKA